LSSESKIFWRNFETFWALFEETAKINSYIRNYMLRQGNYLLF
jgi:hypothetical protein